MIMMEFLKKEINIDERTHQEVSQRQEQKSETDVEKKIINIKSADLEASPVKEYTVEELIDEKSELQTKAVNAIDSNVKKLMQTGIEGKQCDDCQINIVGHEAYEPVMIDSASGPLNSIHSATEEVGVQVNGDFKVIFSDLISNESDLVALCNIESFNTLNELTKLMDKIYPMKKKWLISTRDCIVMTTAKLKLDIPFEALSILFGKVTKKSISIIFYDTLQKLASILSSCVSRVCKEEIMNNMPKCFEDFQRVTTILNCTEICIQQPKCSKCRDKFYSHYKQEYTVKFMTEVTPGGLIVNISKSFGGEASNKAIFNYTDTLRHLCRDEDEIIADAGFLIEEECEEKGIKLHRLVFLGQEKQLSENDALKNKKIAEARVYIERMNTLLIKRFKILENKLPWYMINYIDDIFVTCCGLTNLSSPILSDDEFL